MAGRFSVSFMYRVRECYKKYRHLPLRERVKICKQELEKVISDG